MRYSRALAVGLSLLAIAGSHGSAVAASNTALRIDVLSNRADLISGGNALVEVIPPRGTSADGIRVALNGRDVSSAFALRPDGRYIALLEGLRNGDNVVTARKARLRTARITITNHATGGPVFSGPQIQPWKCFDGSVDLQCNRPPRHQFFYKRTSGGSLQPYDPQNPPSDVAQTTTDHGVTVPFIVRLEIGTIDRDEYRIAVLFDPKQPWAARSPQPQFNRKAVATHGASCDTEYQQDEAPSVFDDTVAGDGPTMALGRGFIVFSHSLNNSGHNCNVVLQAEAMMMTKEHLIENYGELRYTIGNGCSGGALAQQQIANAYPGIYQGITPACSFPDTWSGRMLYEDYSLLRRYFENPASWDPGVVWEQNAMTAVLGHPNYANSIVYNTAIAPLLDPSRSCPGVEASKVYDARANPNGVRCSLQDYMVNVFGRRPQDGFAGRPWDNTGVEYGRKALIAGRISPAQFADVNSKVGGRDIDYEPQPARADADRPALERAYQSGAVNQATHLDKVAIIDLRGPDPGAFHDVYRTYALRARLDREHGTHANQILWRGQVALFGDPAFPAQSILAMDEWLAKVESDPRDIPLPRKIIEDKPDSVQDRCTDGAGHEVGNDECNATVQSYTTARIEAGMPFTDDVIKCDLKPLRRTDYLPVQFSEAEWQKLQTAFPTGVCAYSNAGVDRVPTEPWLTYRNGPGGEPLGREPRSTARRPQCVDRRKFSFKIGQPRGGRVTAVTVYVDGKRVKRLRGRRITRVTLKRLPRGVFSVRIVAETSRRTRTVSVRQYRGCKKGRPRTRVEGPRR